MCSLCVFFMFFVFLSPWLRKQGDYAIGNPSVCMCECVFVGGNVCGDCKYLGINIDGYKLKDLRFADDIALIADSADDLQTLIKQVYDVSKKYRVEISIPKTKAMIFSRQVNIKLDGTSLEQVN